MNLFKRTLMLTLILLLMIPPGSLDDIYKVSAKPDYVMAKDSDFEGMSNLNFRYVGSHEYVEIPHMIKGVNVTSYASLFRDYKGSKLKGVKSTNENVTDVSNMFRNARELTKLDLSNFDTNKVKYMSSMFQDANSLTELDLSNFDTGKVEYMDWMFYNANSLTSLDLSSFDTSNVTNMGYMFENASSLTSLDLSNFNTSKVANMRDMFSSARNLAKLDLSNFDTSNVTDMSYMFSSASSLTSLDLSDFDTSKVTNMRYMLSSANSLTSLDLSNFNTGNVTNMSSMFQDASSLTELDLSNFDTSKVTNMQWMFSNTRSLTKLDLSNFDTSNVTNMSSMFSNASSLTELDLSNFDTSNVTDMSMMFDGASGLTELDLSSFDTSNVTRMNQMFLGARSLAELDLSSFDTSNVTNMQRMFDGANRLTELDLSNFDTSNVTNMGSMFEDASGLTKLDLSSFNTSNVTNMQWMFRGASNLTKLDLSSFDTSKVTNMNWMFLGAKATEGYARTQEDANRLNDSSNKPEDLHFVLRGTPIISFSKDGGDWSNAHSTKVNASWSGGSRDNLQYAWSTSKGEPSSGWANFNSGNTLKQSTGTGNYYLHVKARSKQGIEETFTSEVFKLDNTNPTSPTIDAPTGWQNKDFTFSVTGGSDSHSGVAKREYRLNGGTWTTYSNPVSINSNGTTKVEARTVDSVSNSSSIVSRDVKLDKISPTLNLNPNTRSWTNGDVKITATSSDSHSGIKRIRMSGDLSWINGNKLTKTISENGTYTFRVEDNAGNRTNKDIEVSNIDKDKPSLDLSANIASTTHENVVITAKVSDKDSGVKEVIMPDKSIKKGGSNKTFTATKNGTYEFTVVDNAGNETNKSYKVDNIVRELSLGGVSTSLSSISSKIKSETSKTSIQINDVIITDWRDEVDNDWELTLSSENLSNNKHSYRNGTISFGGVNSVNDVNVDSRDGIHFQSDESIIDDGDVLIVKGEKSRGEFKVNFKGDTVNFNIDPADARVGSYKTTLTWTLSSTPTIN